MATSHPWTDANAVIFDHIFFLNTVNLIKRTPSGPSQVSA